MLVREENQLKLEETEEPLKICDRIANKMLVLDLFDIILELEKNNPNCCLKWKTNR